MKTVDFYTKINEIVIQDTRYSFDGYVFINEAVIYTVKKSEESRMENESSHISGPELLNGVMEYALKNFGPTAYSVFCEWGILDSMAIGNIVFNMIEHRILSRSENDSIKDFKNAFDFKITLCSPFLSINSKPVNSSHIA